MTDEHVDIAAEKISALSRFASVVSHEIKNPLASLKNIAYFLLKTLKSDDEKVKRMLEMLSSELDRINTMVNDLSDISRVRRISKAATIVPDIIQQALTELALPASYTVSASLEQIEALVDPDKMKLIVRNLLTNARDAMPDGGTVTVTLKKVNTSFELTVQDRGIGMDKDVLDHIFEPMFTTKTKVLGLGLTISREIIALHGGTISVRSARGEGSTFTVTMPLA